MVLCSNMNTSQRSSFIFPVQQDMRQCEENVWNVYMVTHKFGKELKLDYAYNVLFLFHDDGLGPESAGGLPNQSV